MRRARIVGLAAVMLVLGGVPARAATPARAFTVSVAAFPVEPAPGLNQTSLGVRPAATRAAVSNPPVSAYGRSAAYDLGTIELYTGPPPPDTVAECDTSTPNIPDASQATPGGMQLAATCDDRPGVEATAAGTSYASSGLGVASMSSRAFADGGADVVAGEAGVTVHGVSMGPLSIDTVTMRATARAGGTPGTATAAGRVTATGATVNGTPVVIGADGIDVDRQRVPLDLVAPATAAVHDALAQGGYADVRVVQPATDAKADGTGASVKGGGVMLFFNRNDPAQNYFIRMTFAGVDLAVDIGQTLGAITTDAGPAAPAPAAGGRDGAVLGTSGAASSPAPAATHASAPAAPVRPVLTSGRRTYDLPEPWQGWPVLVALGAAALVGGLLARRRLLGWWAVNADRYLRG
jgi:hypothetical protein